MTVEIFKTNVQEVADSQQVIARLLEHLPQTKINFDLSDCDRILRVEGASVCVDTVTKLVASFGFDCEILV